MGLFRGGNVPKSYWLAAMSMYLLAFRKKKDSTISDF